VQRAGALSAPQLVWIIENGQLTQRALDGTLVLSMGERVTAFSQVLLSQLRIAYVDDGNVYEAVGPTFEPTQIAEAACAPAYRGNSLELHSPCSESQLVRINLMTREVTTFEPGVFEAYSDSGFSFEMQRDADGLNHQFIEQPGKDKVEIEPPFLDHPFVLDSAYLAGIKILDDSPTAMRRTLAVWSNGKNFDVFAEDEGNVEGYYVVTDYRTSGYLWLVFHNRRETPDVPSHSLGTLSIVSAYDPNMQPAETPGSRTVALSPSRSLLIRQVADNVPLVSPVPRASSVRGYSIESLPTFAKERALAYIDDAIPLERDSRASRGTLHVRLFSGELGSKIADDVTSYHLVTAPVPGVLYGVEEGDQQGLWFASL
jgi:hypothetical protein